MTNVIALSEVDASMLDLVGGKAVGLGAMTRLGERVPPGFCLTTAVHASGEIPEDDLLRAYDRLGGGRVAVRSSATAEDLPDTSFAGQQDTYLNIEGAQALHDAIHRCWDSLHSDRAVAYREANRIDHEAARMAVVVQRMVDARAAGVLFTANPVTGNRNEMTVDAAPGLGTAVVDGSVIPDHYVLDGTMATDPPGCLTAAELTALRDTGRRLQERFGAPQDIEWAIDDEGVLWLLQSRPITTLFPLPPDTGRPGPRVYLNIGPFQGMHRPFTPMGLSLLRMFAAAMINNVGGRVDAIDGPDGLIDIGGRAFVDITTAVRNKNVRANLPEQLRLSQGPRVAAAIERVIGDPGFTPHRGQPFRIRPMLVTIGRHALPVLAGLVAALVRPAAARAKAYRGCEEIRRALATAPEPLTSEARLHSGLRFTDLLLGPPMRWVTTPFMAGLIAGQLPLRLLAGIVTRGEVDAVLRGMPYNITTEMDLELWRLAARATDHRELLTTTPPAELASRYRHGDLPGIGLGEFLRVYGHRTAGEIDTGLPRWDEDPTPVFASIANYLQITDPDQAPDRRFARAAADAEATLEQLVARARRSRPVRARLARFLFRRARALAGIRELLKFAWIPVLQYWRRQILIVGAELADRGLLDKAEDIMFLDMREAEAAVAGTDRRALAAKRRIAYERETHRRNVPDVLLSDGTIPEALAPTTTPDGALQGMAGAPGTATGPARVILDPTQARLEPGEVLVAPSTDPGWTPLFLTAAALVTETGGPNAHGPTVAREYGIPAAIGIPHATESIRTGQQITVDGSAGTVTVHDTDRARQPPKT